MKTLLNICLAGLLPALVSCKKYFIQLSPESTVSVDVLFKTDKDLQDAVIGIYGNFRPQYLNYWRFGDLRGDDTKFGLVSQLEDIRNDNFTSDNSDPVLASSWKNYYSIISRAFSVSAGDKRKDTTASTASSGLYGPNGVFKPAGKNL
jgi:hypothetical protein